MQINWTLNYSVEQINGMEFNDYLTQKIFLPLGVGMVDSISAVNSGDVVKELKTPRWYITLYGKVMPWTELEQIKN